MCPRIPRGLWLASLGIRALTALAIALGAVAALAQSRTSGTIKVGRIEFVRIPKGSCLTGSQPEDLSGLPSSMSGRGAKENVIRTTILRDFALAAHEITVADYYSVIDPKKVVATKDRDRPMAGVSYEEAEEFCKKLSTTSGKRIRLPYEDEWEYACRARPVDSPGELFGVWKGDLKRDVELLRKGNKTPIETHATKAFNYKSDASEPVGRYASNAWGLYDMHGNVWEWCISAGRGRANEWPGLQHRPIRGGAWTSLSWTDCRSSKRAWELKNAHKNSIGFRPLLEL